MRVFHFSGGRTSAYMVLHYWRPGDLVLFCDTGKEDPGTYEFIDKLERIDGIPVIRLSYTGGWKELIRKRGAVPNKFKRKCTEELKIKTARRYLRSIGLFRYTQFIGFRADEPSRVDGYKNYWQAVETLFPLDEDNITKPIILDFFRTYKYDLEIPEILGNCDLCFLKGIPAILDILTNKPELADKWIDEEESSKRGHTYHSGVTMRQLKEKALTMPKADISNLKPLYKCACTA